MRRIYAILTFVLMLPILPILGIGGLSQLLGNLGGLGGIPTKNTVPARQGYRTDIGVTDGDAAYNTAAEVYGAIGAAGVWVTVWEMTIPAQQAVHWGYGSPATPQNQGYMWFAMLDSGTDWSVGKVRLFQNSARRTKYRPVCEVSDVALHSTTVTTIATAALLDKNQMYALPEKVEFPLVGEDSIIGIEYRLVTAATVVDAAGFKIPITVYQ